MQDFDPAKLRAHRLKEAEAGFPLLRGAPNTDAIARLVFLDALSDSDKIAFATQLADLDAAQAADANAPFETLLRAPPLVEAYYAARRAPAQGLAFMPVKLYAGVCKDTGVGGFAGFAKMVAMPPEAQTPAIAHAASLSELAPVAPKRLRKLIDEAMTSRFGATAARVSSDHTRYNAAPPGGVLTVDVMFPRGMGPSWQVEHRFSAKMANGRSVWMKSYEGVWRLTPRWDYLTEANAERSIAHFVRLIEACVDLI